MNSKFHLILSFVKSGIRIIGAMISLVEKDFMILAYTILVAEILGILEEVGDKR